MRPHRPLMCFHLLLHSGNHHRLPCICEQSMLSDPLHMGTVGQIVHIVFPFRQQIQIPFQGRGNKFRGVSSGWMKPVIFIFQHRPCLRQITKQLYNQLLLRRGCGQVPLALINLFHTLSGSDVLDIVPKLLRRGIPQIAAGKNNFRHGVLPPSSFLSGWTIKN